MIKCAFLLRTWSFVKHSSHTGSHEAVLLSVLSVVTVLQGGAQKGRPQRMESLSSLAPGPRSRCTSQLCPAGQVLSVETALSIQSHPDKALAARLHAERPQVLPEIKTYALNPIRLNEGTWMGRA